MKCKVVLCRSILLILALSAYSYAAEATGGRCAVTAQDWNRASHSTNASNFMAQPNLVAPNDCYYQCVQDQYNQYCSHLDPSLQQHCFMFVEEGCRCGCGMYCP